MGAIWTERWLLLPTFHPCQCSAELRAALVDVGRVDGLSVGDDDPSGLQREHPPHAIACSRPVSHEEVAPGAALSEATAAPDEGQGQVRREPARPNHVEGEIGEYGRRARAGAIAVTILTLGCCALAVVALLDRAASFVDAGR